MQFDGDAEWVSALHCIAIRPVGAGGAGGPKGAGGAGGAMALSDFGRSVNPFQSEGADYFPNYNWQPRTFQTFLQPWQCNAISASISSNVLHQMMLTSKLIFDNKIGAFDDKLGLISYTYAISKSHSIIVNLKNVIIVHSHFCDDHPKP